VAVLLQWRTHVDDAKDDRHLHLVRVGEHKPILSAMPAWVEANRINVAVIRSLYLVRLPVPTRVPNVHRLAEDIVVHDASKHGEDAHENDDVATAVVNATLVYRIIRTS
jgi:hypothetical protein